MQLRPVKKTLVLFLFLAAAALPVQAFACSGCLDDGGRIVCVAICQQADGSYFGIGADGRGSRGSQMAEEDAREACRDLATDAL